MNIFITRILKFLLRIGIIKKIWVIEYDGKIFSLNALYSQKHWSARKALKDKYKNIFSYLLKEEKVANISEFLIGIFYNTRHDVDNMVGIEKIFVDTMKGKQIQEDSKKYFKGLFIFADDSLKKGMIKLLILKLK